MQSNTSSVRKLFVHRNAVLAFATLATIAQAGLVYAGTTWDAGGGANSNIDLAANWNPDGNAIDGTSAVTAISAGTLMTMNVDAKFTSFLLGRTVAFTINGPNNLILTSVNTGSTYNLTLSSTSNTHTINAPILIDTTNTTNKLFSIRNNRTTAGQILDINGSIGRSGNSTSDFLMRYEGLAGSVTRIDGAISNMTNLQQSTGAAWAGDLIFGGNRSSSAGINIGSTGSGTTPATTARLLLGETPSDNQTWGNLNLNNTMKLVIGGNVTMGTIAVAGIATAATSRVVGNSATNSTVSFTGGTINNLCTFGGAGTNENNFSLVKAGSGALNITGGTHTFAGASVVNGGTLSISAGVVISSPFIVNAGTLSVAAGEALTSPVTINSGGALIGEGSTGSTLTFASGSSSLTFDPATTGAFAAASVVTSGALVTVIPSSTTTIGTPYLVLTNSAGFTGSPTASFLAGTRGTLSYAGGGNTDLILTPGGAASLMWKGNDGTNPTFWDTATTVNWLNGGPVLFFASDAVTFDDSASSFNVAIQGSAITPGNVVINNSLPNTYTFTGGGIGGSGSITKNGAGLASIAGALANTGGLSVTNGTLILSAATGSFTGGISVTGGELMFGNLAALNPAGNSVTLGAGTMAYTGSATATNDVQAFFIDANGAEVSTATSGATPATVTWRIGGKVSGAGDWTKSGVGVLSLGRANNTNSNNDFTGKLTVTGGTLDIRYGDSLGATSAGTEIQGSTLLIQNFGQTTGSTVTVAEPLTFSGTSYLTSLSQETKNFTNQFTGPIAVSGTLGVSTARNGTSTQTILELNSNTVTLAAGSTLALGKLAASYPVPTTTAAQTINISSNIVGSGGLSTEGDAASTYTLSGTSTYSGATTVNGGTLKIAGSHNPVTPGSLGVNGTAIAAIDGGSATFSAVHATNLIVRNGGTMTVAASDGDGAGAGIRGAAASVAKVTSLSIDGTSKFDLKNNALIIPASGNLNGSSITVSTLRAAIIAGRGGTGTGAATWSGTGGIGTSTFSFDETFDSIGYCWTGDPNVLIAPTDLNGETYTMGDYVVKYCAGADADLNGLVDDTDVAVIGLTYDSGATTGHHWYEGDFNYDGLINDDDVAIIGLAYNPSGAPLSPAFQAALSAEYGSSFASAFASGAGTVVPEPTSLGLLALGAMGLLRRRRK